MSNVNIIEIRPYGPHYIIALDDNRKAETRCLQTTAEQDGEVGQHFTVGLAIEDLIAHAENDTIVLHPANAAAIGAALLEAASIAAGTDIVDTLASVRNVATIRAEDEEVENRD